MWRWTRSCEGALTLAHAPTNRMTLEKVINYRDRKVLLVLLWMSFIHKHTAEMRMKLCRMMLLFVIDSAFDMAFLPKFILYCH